MEDVAGAVDEDVDDEHAGGGGGGVHRRLFMRQFPLQTPSIGNLLALCFFFISTSLCGDISLGILFIEGFRSRRRGWRWNRWHPSNEVENNVGGPA
jgi:hypothetical protein